MDQVTQVRGRRERIEPTDYRHRFLLRAQGTCCVYRDSEQDNEAPTVHPILMQLNRTKN